MHQHEPSAHFERISPTVFRASQLTSGAWNTEEQHIAPAIGLLTHAVERDRDERRDDAPQISRLSYDILGPLPVAGDMEITCRLLRPGRTIELVEAQLSQNGRAAVVVRAWLLTAYATESIAGSPLPAFTAVEDTEPWDATSVWPGDFIASLEVRRHQFEPGRAHIWARTEHPLVAGEQVSPLAATMGLVDISNGMTVRKKPEEVLFPNLDLTAHIFRQPDSAWVGLDTTVSFGATGIGLTHTVLHDTEGPIGVMSQSLTVRPH